jgi:hypothetical protein
MVGSIKRRTATWLQLFASLSAFKRDLENDVREVHSHFLWIDPSATWQKKLRI